MPPTKVVEITNLVGCEAIKNSTKMNDKELESKIDIALEEIRPFLKSDGGDISFVSIDDGKAC